MAKRASPLGPGLYSRAADVWESPSVSALRSRRGFPSVAGFPRRFASQPQTLLSHLTYLTDSHDYSTDTRQFGKCPVLSWPSKPCREYLTFGTASLMVRCFPRQHTPLVIKKLPPTPLSSGVKVLSSSQHLGGRRKDFIHRGSETVLFQPSTAATLELRTRNCHHGVQDQPYSIRIQHFVPRCSSPQSTLSTFRPTGRLALSNSALSQPHPSLPPMPPNYKSTNLHSGTTVMAR